MKWIEVTGFSNPLWVSNEQCRLANGDLAWETVTYPTEKLPLPPWFAAPVNSTVRRQFDMPLLGLIVNETRSARAPLEEILAFYRDCAGRGGLVFAEERPGERLTPGFRAANRRESLSVDLFGYNELTFWTVSASDEDLLRVAFRPAKTIYPLSLALTGRDREKASLRDPLRGVECWCPADALTDVEPWIPQRELEPVASVVWSSLPEWVQFGIEAGRTGTMGIRREPPGRGCTEEFSIGQDLDGDHRDAFHRCLASLDARGFDATGADPATRRAYFVVVRNSGRSLEASYVSADERGEVTLQNTLGRVRMVVQYRRPVPPAPTD